MWNWYNQHNLDYAYYLMAHQYGNVCVCCDDFNIQVGHIVRPLVVVIKSKYTKSGLYASHKSKGAGNLVKDCEAGLCRPTCPTCNISQGGEEICLTHQKYIGLWLNKPTFDPNFVLPQLSNMEQDF